jgi:hypothetical protein
MFYLSPTLTVMMLGIVPPVSLGAVSRTSYYCSGILALAGILWPLLEKAFEPDARGDG